MPAPLSLWGPVAVWMAAIFASSERPVPASVGLVPDWVTHGAAYAVLGALFMRALSGGRSSAVSLRAGLLAVLLSGAYGALDELHQSFVPERSAEAADVGKDLGGAAVGALVWRRYASGT